MAPQDVATFSPAMVADMPEIARRYFAHAIAPGTKLFGVVELEMSGAFVLGTPPKARTFAMVARQILAPPLAYVWSARVSRGLFWITGSDAQVGQRLWTRFFLWGLYKLVDAPVSRDLARAAAARPAIEAIWVPASLLPTVGTVWVQTGADTATVTVVGAQGPVAIDLRLGADGAVRAVLTQRWSDASPDKIYRSLPFGGTITAEAAFAGFTIPSQLEVGYGAGTPDFAPFFKAVITRARFR